MSKTIEYDFQTPKYTSPAGKFIKLDTVNNQIEINDPTVPKQILINTTEISNGVQNINFVNLYEKLDAVKATVYPATASNILTVNDTIVLDNGTGSISTSTVSSLAISATGIGGPINTVTAGDMTIQDNPGTAIAQMTADYVQITSSGNYSSTLYPNVLTISNSAGDVFSQTASNDIQLTDTTSNIQLELVNDVNLYAEPYMRLQNQNGSNTYMRYGELNADEHVNFLFTNNNGFFKLNNPFSYVTYTLPDGGQVERYMGYVFGDNIANLAMYDPTQYLDTAGNPGWSYIVSNLSGSDLLVDSHGVQWFAHSNGLGGSPIVVKKYATVRITLLYSSTLGDYVYAVSQF